MVDSAVDLDGLLFYFFSLFLWLGGWAADVALSERTSMPVFEHVGAKVTFLLLLYDVLLLWLGVFRIFLLLALLGRH